MKLTAELLRRKGFALSVLPACVSRAATCRAHRYAIAPVCVTLPGQDRSQCRLKGVRGKFGLEITAWTSGRASSEGTVTKLPLPDQAVQILAMLLERPGEVVTRDQLIARLWPNGTVVEFDHGINSSIRRLRAALNDS